MIMCKRTTNQEGICLEVPIEHIRRHKELLEEDDDRIAEIVGDLLRDAAIKGTKMILENNWHEFTVDDESPE